MNVLYIAPSGKPPVPGTDGLCTEIGYLRQSVGGDCISMSAFRGLPPVFPVRLYGLRHTLTLKKFSRNKGLVHIFFPYLVDFCALRALPSPIVYTITSGVDAGHLPRTAPPFTLVVSSEQEEDILKNEGYRDVHVIRPGIDLTRITVTPPPATEKEFVILAGSAPWTEEQFVKKGFDLMLELLHLIPDLRLVCLWRGALRREWDRRVDRAGLSGKVEVIGEMTDVSHVLSRCHCAVVLASQQGLVKSYPNSLMEALAAGRPVIASRAIPMSSYIGDTGCGRVIGTLSLDELADALEDIIDHYDAFRAAATRVGRRDLSADRMVGEYRDMYRVLVQ